MTYVCTCICMFPKYINLNHNRNQIYHIPLIFSARPAAAAPGKTAPPTLLLKSLRISKLLSLPCLNQKKKNSITIFFSLHFNRPINLTRKKKKPPPAEKRKKP